MTNQGPEQPDILGLEALDQSAAEHILSQRRLGAVNVLSQLAMRDKEYLRRQSELNGAFLNELTSTIAEPSLSYSNNENRRFNTCTVNDLGVDLRIDVAGHAIDQLDEEVLADVNALRAGIVWIERNVSDVLSIERSTLSLTKLNIKPTSLIVPHIVVGHKQTEAQQTEVLFMALRGKAIGDQYFATWIQTEDGSTTLQWRNPLLQVTMPKSQFTELKDLQDILLGEGLSAEEVVRLYSERRKSLILNPETIPVLRVKLDNRHLIGRHQIGPHSISDLASRSFSAVANGQPSTSLGPETFLNFNVLHDTQVVAAMFNQSQKFEHLKGELINKTFSDPTIAWVNDPNK